MAGKVIDLLGRKDLLVVWEKSRDQL